MPTGPKAGQEKKASQLVSFRWPTDFIRAYKAHADRGRISDARWLQRAGWEYLAQHSKKKAK